MIKPTSEKLFTTKEIVFIIVFFLLAACTFLISTTNINDSMGKAEIIQEVNALEKNNYLDYQDVSEQTCNNVLKFFFNKENLNYKLEIYVNDDFAQPKDIQLRHLLCSHEKNYLQFIKY